MVFENIFSPEIYLSYMKITRIRIPMAINPANPVAPMVRSFHPSSIIIPMPAVAFNVPCITAAAITERVFSVM